MLKRYLPFLLLLAIVACNKTKFETKPTIIIKNINSEEIHLNQDLQFTLEYSDKEGDVGDGEVTYVRDRKNILPIPDYNSNNKPDTVRYPVPTFPKTASGDISVTVPYSFLLETPNDNDTMVFRFVLKDAGGNISDTIASQTIVAFHD